MPVIDGVHAIPLEYDFGDRTMTIHPTAVETERGLLLIDAGLPGAREQFESALDDAGHDVADARLLLFTHQDADHVGGYHDLDEVGGFDPLVAAPAAEAPAIDGRETPVKSEEGDRYPPVDVDLELVGGESLRTRAGPVRVVDTPGHTPGHVSLYFPEASLLLAGDALTVDDGSLAPPKPQYTPDWEEARTSVRELANFDVDRIVCYHGGVVDADGDDIRRIHEEMDEG